MILKSNKGKTFSQEEAIDLMVSLSATDINSERKWKGFYNSLSKAEVEVDGMSIGKLIESNKVSKLIGIEFQDYG